MIATLLCRDNRDNVLGLFLSSPAATRASHKHATCPSSAPSNCFVIKHKPPSGPTGPLPHQTPRQILLRTTSALQFLCATPHRPFELHQTSLISSYSRKLWGAFVERYVSLQILPAAGLNEQPPTTRHVSIPSPKSPL